MSTGINQSALLNNAVSRIEKQLGRSFHHRGFDHLKWMEAGHGGKVTFGVKVNIQHSREGQDVVEQRIGVGLHINSSSEQWNRAVYDLLNEHFGEIATAFGPGDVIWQIGDGHKGAQIFIPCPPDAQALSAAFVRLFELIEPWLAEAVRQADLSQ